MKTFTLEDKQYELLMKILKEAEESRSSMSCNDPYPSEERMFTKEERIKIGQELWPVNYGDDYEDEAGFLFNSDYVCYVINEIEKQI